MFENTTYDHFHATIVPQSGRYEGQSIYIEGGLSPKLSFEDWMAFKQKPLDKQEQWIKDLAFGWLSDSYAGYVEKDKFLVRSFRVAG